MSLLSFAKYAPPPYPPPVEPVDPYSQEAKVLDCLKTALHKLWESSRYTIPVNQGQLVQGRLTEGVGAFTLQDTAAKSPPPPATPAGASRVGIVSPGPLEDLVAGEAASADQDEVLPASGRLSEMQAGKGPANGQVTKKSLKSCSGASEVQEAGAKGGEDEKRCARDARSAVAARPTRSLDPAKREAGDRPQATSHRVEESDGASQDSAGNPATTGSSVDANEYAIEREGRGGGAMGAERTPAQTGGTAGASAKGAGGAPNLHARSGVPCLPLAYDMRSILGGCRRASRLKRKRDARNASADSFSAKLSGCGAKDQDSKAAARAFSRVLHKVGCVRVACCQSSTNKTHHEISLSSPC